MFAQFIEMYGMEILKVIVLGVATYLGNEAKKLYAKYINDKRKREIAETVVRGVEQIYKDLHGEKKLNKALSAASEILAENGLPTSDLELRMLIEAALAKFNDAFNKTAVPKE